MAIQTEVTLQKDYMLSACEGGKAQCIAEIVLLSPTPVVKSSTIILVVLIFCPQCGATQWRIQECEKGGAQVYYTYMSTQENVLEGQMGSHQAKRANLGRGVRGSSPGKF